MTTIRSLRRRFVALGALPLALVLATAGEVAYAGDDCQPARSVVNRRILASAAQGDAALVRFVNRTKAVYQLDLMETVAWLEAQRVRRATCLSAMVQLPPIAP